MSKEGKVTVVVQGQDNLSPTLHKAQGDIDSFASAAKEQFNDIAKTVGKLFVAEKAYEFAKEGLKAYAEQEQINVRLAASIEKVGVSYQSVKERVNEFSEGQQKLTLFDAEDIKSALGTVIQLTGKFGDSSEQAVKAAENLAQATGMDLVSASRAVALAFEGNMRGLGQYVPALKEMGQAQLAAMDPAERMAVVLAALEKQYGGQATAIDETKKALSDLKISYDDLQKATGGLIAQTGGLSLMRAVTKDISDATGMLKGEVGGLAATLLRWNPFTGLQVTIASMMGIDISEWVTRTSETIKHLWAALSGADYAGATTEFGKASETWTHFATSVREAFDAAGAAIDRFNGKSKQAPEVVAETSKATQQHAADITLVWRKAWGVVAAEGQEVYWKLRSEKLQKQHDIDVAAARKYAEEMRKAYEAGEKPGENEKDSPGAKQAVKDIEEQNALVLKAQEQADTALWEGRKRVWAQGQMAVEQDFTLHLKYLGEQEQRYSLLSVNNERHKISLLEGLDAQRYEDARQIALAKQRSDEQEYETSKQLALKRQQDEKQIQQVIKTLQEVNAVTAQASEIASHYADVFGASQSAKLKIIETALAIEAGLQAGMEMARGFAALANPYGGQVEAGLHFAAAGMFSMVATEHAGNALGAWNTAGAGASGGGGGGGGSSYSGAGTTNRRGESAGSNGTTVINNYYPQGHLIQESQAGRQAYTQHRSAVRSGGARD